MVGMWKAFAEMSTLGWIDPVKRPRMVTVQASGCAPIIRAYDQGTEKAAPWENAHTIADGLRVPRAVGDFLVLRAVRDSGGAAVAVDDGDMVAGMKDTGRARRRERRTRRRRCPARHPHPRRTEEDPSARARRSL
jgi:threonine synthase